jgi:hypothetical protein
MAAITRPLLEEAVALSDAAQGDDTERAEARGGRDAWGAPACARPSLARPPYRTTPRGAAQDAVGAGESRAQQQPLARRSFR